MHNASDTQVNEAQMHDEHEAEKVEMHPCNLTHVTDWHPHAARDTV